MATNPFNRDILQGKDQHRQHKKADSLHVGTDFVHMMTMDLIAFFELRDFRIHTCSIGEVWRGLWPLQTSPMVLSITHKLPDSGGLGAAGPRKTRFVVCGAATPPHTPQQQGVWGAAPCAYPSVDGHGGLGVFPQNLSQPAGGIWRCATICRHRRRERMGGRTCDSKDARAARPPNRTFYLLHCFTRVC